MAARQQPLRPPSSSTMVVRIRTVDGSMRRVSLLTSKTAPANTNINDTNETAVPPSADSTTLSEILALAGVTHQLGSEDDNIINDTHSIQLGSNTTVLNLTSDGNKTMTELGLVHGSIITILKPPPSKVANSNDKKKNEEDESRFDPFPELATSSSSTTSATSSSISRRRREIAMKQNKRLHVIGPQSTTSSGIARVNVCEASAAKFRNHCITTTAATATKKRKAATATTIMENRVGLLFGTVENNNNANDGRTRRKTVSSGSSDETIVSVHAIWEPTNQIPSKQYTDHYDDKCLLLPPSLAKTTVNEEEVEEEVDVQRAIRIGGWLGLRPVGWIFSYTNDRTKEVDSHGTTISTTTSTSTALPPIYVRDVIMGSKLQIQTMKYNRMLNRHNDDDDDNGRKDFVTLAMNCVNGMTESFQFSNVCVQMVAEGVLSFPVQKPPQRDDGNTRLAKLLAPVLVSDEETTILDTVLLLINLAMFSHVGFYSGDAPSPATSTGVSSVKRSTGELFTKTRKRILTLLLVLPDTKKKQHQQQQLENDDKDVVDGELLKLLCDFDILLALDALLDRNDSEKLCLLVKQYATTVKNKKTSMKNNKKKQPIVLDEQLRLTLQTVLDIGF